MNIREAVGIPYKNIKTDSMMNKFCILEFSTPGVLDIPNIIYEMEHTKAEISPFFRYILQTRKDPNLLEAFQDFLQMNKLSSFARIVLKKG